MKSVNCSKPGYTSSKIENIPYNLIFTTKYNDSSILITIISWEYMNLSFANEYVGDVTIPTQVIKYNQFFSRRISQSDGSFHIKLNYKSLDNRDKNYKQCQNLANSNVQKDVSLNILQGRHGQDTFKKQKGHGNNSQWVFSQ